MAEGFASAGSDARFQLLLKALDVRNARPKGSRVEQWKTPSGKRGARIQTDKATTTLIFEDKVVPNLRTYRAACKAAAAAGEFEKCEELLDDVKDAFDIRAVT